MTATHIVCPTDFSPQSNRGFYHALAVALAEKARLTTLHVGADSRDRVAWQRFPRVRDTLVRWQMLDHAGPRAAVSEQLSIKVHKMAMRDEEPAQGILDFLEENRTDLLVMATGAPQRWGRLWRCSTALRILRGAPTDVLLLPDGSRDLVDPDTGRSRLQRVLLPITPEVDARAAISLVDTLLSKIAAGELSVTALRFGAGEGVRTGDPPDRPGTRWQTIQTTGGVVDGTVAAAERLDVDLIVMTGTGRRTPRELQGERLEQVLRRARRPLLAVPAE